MKSFPKAMEIASEMSWIYMVRYTLCKLLGIELSYLHAIGVILIQVRLFNAVSVS